MISYSQRYVALKFLFANENHECDIYEHLEQYRQQDSQEREGNEGEPYHLRRPYLLDRGTRAYPGHGASIQAADDRKKEGEGEGEGEGGCNEPLEARDIRAAIHFWGGDPFHGEENTDGRKDQYCGEYIPKDICKRRPSSQDGPSGHDVVASYRRQGLHDTQPGVYSVGMAAPQQLKLSALLVITSDAITIVLRLSLVKLNACGGLGLDTQARALYKNSLQAFKLAMQTNTVFWFLTSWYLCPH